MSRDHTIRGIKYVECDLCGFIYRITDTHINDAGLRVCRFHCTDKGKYRRFTIDVSSAVTSSVVTSTVVGPDGLNADGIISMGWWDISSMNEISIVTDGFESDLE